MSLKHRFLGNQEGGENAAVGGGEKEEELLDDGDLFGSMSDDGEENSDDEFGGEEDIDVDALVQDIGGELEGEGGASSSRVLERPAPYVAKYDAQGFGDAADRERLMGMKEIEREEILSERVDQQTRERRAYERRLKRWEDQQRAAGAAVEDGEEEEGRGGRGGRESSRSERKRRMDQLAQQKRAKDKAARNARLGMDDDGLGDDDGGMGYGDGFADDDEDWNGEGGSGLSRMNYGDDDGAHGYRMASETEAYKSEYLTEADYDEWGIRNADATDKQLEPGMEIQGYPLGLQELRGIQLKRSHLDRLLFEPDLDKIVAGMYVRYGVASGSNSGPVYKIYQVVGVTDNPEDEEYVFGTYRTRRRLLLRTSRGDTPRSMSYVSNTEIQPHEYDTLMQFMHESSSVVIPTKFDAVMKNRALRAKDGRARTEEEIIQMTKAKRNAAASSTGTIRPLGVEKAQLKLEHAEALEAGDEVRAAAIQERITEIEKAKDETYSAQKANQASISSINARARQVNFNALMNRKKNLARLAANRVDAKHDPFARQDTVPTVMWKVRSGEDEEKEKEEEEEGEGEEGEESGKGKGKGGKEEGPLTSSELKKSLSAMHDFDLDLDLDIDEDDVAPIDPKAVVIRARKRV